MSLSQIIIHPFSNFIQLKFLISINNFEMIGNVKHNYCNKNLKDALSRYTNQIFFGMLNECETTRYLKKYKDYNKETNAGISESQECRSPVNLISRKLFNICSL